VNKEKKRGLKNIISGVQPWFLRKKQDPDRRFRWCILYRYSIYPCW